MPAGFRTELVGAKEAVRSLNKIEPGLRKQFAVEATRIAQPAISEAQRRYSAVGWGSAQVRGVSGTWNDKGRLMFPWDPNKAGKSVKVKIDSDRRRTAVIVIEQRDPGTAVLEAAGRKTDNGLGRALGFLQPNRSRILGPAVFSKRAEVSDQMEKAMLTAINKVQRELK
jgi:hypothetical protein